MRVSQFAISDRLPGSNGSSGPVPIQNENGSRARQFGSEPARNGSTKAWPQFYHIGAPRTGTTTIQVTLGADPRVHLFRSEFFNTPLWYSGRPDFVMASDQVNVLSAETLVRKHQQRFKFSTTLEHICQVAPRAHIMLTIREQRSWLLSRYRWGVGSTGLYGSFEKWLRSPEGGDFLSIGRFATLLRYVSSLFPDKQIHVMLFEHLRDDYQGFFDQLYGVLGLSAPPLQKTIANPSQPDEELVVRRMLNRLGVFGPGRILARKKNAVHKRLVRLAQRSPGVTGRNRLAEWGADALFRSIEEDLRQSNAELQKLCGVDLARHGYLV